MSAEILTFRSNRGTGLLAVVPGQVRALNVSSASLSIAVLAGTAALLPGSVQACAACYGASDSAMAAGMNWGIISMLGMITAVLGGIAACFIALARRCASKSNAATEAALVAQAEASWPSVGSEPTLSDMTGPDRAGLKPVSRLAQQRKHCSHSGRLTAPHSRS